MFKAVILTVNEQQGRAGGIHTTADRGSAVSAAISGGNQRATILAISFAHSHIS